MSKLKYFYRIDQNNKPIPGTLEKFVKRPKIGKWGEITGSDLERKPCCVQTPLNESAILGITGPSGTIATGSQEYFYAITSSVTGVPDEDVVSISLYIDDVFVSLQEGNNFYLDYSGFAEVPSVPTVYYTVAILSDGSTLVSPIMQFTLTETAASWTFQQAFYIAKTDQTMHIVDMVSDVDLDTLSISFLTLPSFITASLIPVTGVNGVSVVIVDLTVTPGASDSATYSFTMRADDGLTQTDKVVSLQVNTSTHQQMTVRPTGTAAITTASPSGTVLNTFTISSTINGIQMASLPSPVLFSTSNGSGPGSVNITTNGAVSGTGKQVTIYQTRNSSTGTGNRYEDCAYLITTVT